MDGRLLRPVLIFDQFEELFTIIGPKKLWKESFIKELADLVRRRVPEEIRDRETAKLENLEKLGRDEVERERIACLLFEGDGPDVKIVISIREDFLAEMETLKCQLPTIFRNSFRLEPLGIDEARKAIELPAQQSELLGDNTFTFAPGVVDELLAFLRVQKIGGKLISGDTVEPVQLQILCQHLHRQSVKKKERRARVEKPQSTTEAKSIPEITLNDLKGRNGMKRAIVGYYHKVLKKFPRLRFGWSARRYRPSLSNLLVVHRARANVRYLSENKLVTPGGYRNSVSVDVIQHGIGVPKEDLARLVDERLLRTEPRLGSHFYELTHDTLIRPLVKARLKRRIYWAISVFSLIVVLVSLPTVASNLLWYIRVFPLRNIASNSKMSEEQRISALREVFNSDYNDCSNCDLKSLDLHSLRVANVNFSGAGLNNVDLKGASLISSDFSKADLSGANLNSAKLSFSNFTGASVQNADLSKADLQSANLTNAILNKAKLLDDETR